MVSLRLTHHQYLVAHIRELTCIHSNTSFLLFVLLQSRVLKNRTYYSCASLWTMFQYVPAQISWTTYFVRTYWPASNIFIIILLDFYCAWNSMLSSPRSCLPFIHTFFSFSFTFLITSSFFSMLYRSSSGLLVKGRGRMICQMESYRSSGIS